MNTTSLADYCRQNTQNAAASLLGWTQGAVWQALAKGREIYVVAHDDGTHSAYEVRQLAGRPVRVKPALDAGEAA
jgi:hypothetical protein